MQGKMEIINEEQGAFCDVLSQRAMRVDGEYRTGYKLRDSLSQAQLVSMYSSQVEASRQGFERQIRARGESLSMGILDDGGAAGAGAPGVSFDSLRREAAEARAERDLWSLLDILTRSELLVDLDSPSCETALRAAMGQLTERSSVEDVENTALCNDDRIKKGRVLLEWLEDCATDRVTLAPELRADPWAATLDAISRDLRSTVKASKSSSSLSDTVVARINSMHPDAQLTPDGLVLPLEGGDCDQQELVLRSIWQLLRCGKMKDAQEVALKNKLYWLAASLLGRSQPFYETTTVTVSRTHVEDPADDVENAEM
jgi:Nuclear pore protein 84 / 107